MRDGTSVGGCTMLGDEPFLAVDQSRNRTSLGEVPLLGATTSFCEDPRWKQETLRLVWSDAPASDCCTS